MYIEYIEYMLSTYVHTRFVEYVHIEYDIVTLFTFAIIGEKSR